MSFDLNYTISGEGRAFFFQHGLGANVAQPQGLLGGLDGVQLISMDCRGHGESVLAAEDVPSFSVYSQDVRRLMDHLGIEKAVFGGISMGAGISTHMAIHHPDRVEGLILVRPAWLDQGSPANLAILLDIAELINQPNAQAIFEQKSEFARIQSELPNAAKSIMGMFSRPQGVATSRILNHMVQDAPITSMTDLNQLSHPTLVIANEDDPLHPYSFAVDIAERIPTARLEKVISRYINNEQHRAEVRSLVSSFLSHL